MEIVRYLVKQGADINAKDNKGFTSLYAAAQNGHLEVVKYLVEHGADINKATNTERTTLYIAAQNGHLAVVKYLVEHGADVNKPDRISNTPLRIAKSKLQTPTFSELQKQKYQEIISYLISKGAKDQRERMVRRK